MKEDANPNSKYEEAKKERKKYVENILRSESSKKVVVAGPGTGKTLLFKEVLEKKDNTLALTFINALVEDLSLELCGLSDVKTLHGFAYSKLREAKEGIEIFPKLTEVIKKDAEILIEKEINFKKIFDNKKDDSEYIDFYRERKDYYGKYYGFSGIVYAIVKYFEEDHNKIPQYNQIVVDEFQDFNLLEVSLIELLSRNSPMLLVGDDDQAIYDFKDADPKHIRQKHSQKETDYEPFDLPFCSRCTRVIVEVVNDIIDSASKKGFFSARIPKPYKYFDDEKKDIVSEKYPKVVHSQQFARKIPWFLGKQILEIAQNSKSKFSVLVICPTKIQCNQLAEDLIKKGFNNIEYKEKQDENVILLDGLKLLLKNDKCNLGWRIVSEFLLKGKEFKSFLKKTHQDRSTKICELIDKDCKAEVKKMIKVLKTCQKDEDINEENLDILKRIGKNPYKIVKDVLKDELDFDFSRMAKPEVRKIPIKITTIQGSKGLSGDYVFITYFDDQYFIKSKDKKEISDKDIRNFLVALTRAREKVSLISSQKREPTFLKWINEERIEAI
ncbi:MAG: AAA family ATPase [Candidatus Aminicenantes bacterium]|nr:AAA family ATPase [Candidatus Aminicenantes bacterium]